MMLRSKSLTRTLLLTCLCTSWNLCAATTEDNPESPKLDEVMEDFVHLPQRFSMTDLSDLLDRHPSRVRVSSLASYNGNSAALAKEVLAHLKKGQHPAIFSLGNLQARALLHTAFSGDMPVTTDYSITVVFPFTAEEDTDPTTHLQDERKEWTFLQNAFEHSSMKISDARYTYPPTMLHRHFSDLEREYAPYEGVKTYIYDHLRPDMTELEVDRTASTSYKVYYPQGPHKADLHVATLIFTPTDKRFATMPLAPRQVREKFLSAVAFGTGGMVPGPTHSTSEID